MAKAVKSLIVGEDHTIQWVLAETDTTAPDPRQLKELINIATKLHDEAYVEDQDDPLIGSWQLDQEAIDELQKAITEAKKVSAGYLQTVFTQEELDEASTALQDAIDAFKLAGIEVIKDLEEFNALKARMEKVNNLVNVSSEEGRDVTFGESWVTTQEREVMDRAYHNAELMIEVTRLQSLVDSTCVTLNEAVTLYESQVKVAEPDTTLLEETINRANETKSGVLVSSDPEGHDLEMGTEFVLDQGIIDTLVEVITRAEEIKVSAKNQNELNAITEELAEAIVAFSDQVRKTFDWYDIPEEIDWGIVPWKWVPFEYDWTRFPWERIDYDQIDVDSMPWDVKAAMDTLAQNAGEWKISFLLINIIRYLNQT